MDAHHRAVMDLVRASRALAQRVARLEDEAHAALDLTGAQREVIGQLRNAAQTVPQLARARDVSRQHVQATVNPLLERGLLERVPNPAHKRSALLRLTAAGAGIADRIVAGGAWLAHASPGTAELHAAAVTLRRLSASLDPSAPPEPAPGESDPSWRTW